MVAGHLQEKNGYIKRLPTAEYRAQGRGGKGVKAMATREEVRRSRWMPTKKRFYH